MKVELERHGGEYFFSTVSQNSLSEAANLCYYFDDDPDAVDWSWSNSLLPRLFSSVWF